MTFPRDAGRGAAFAQIATAIRAAGPLSFDRFMDLALYHPACGYYRRGGRPPRDYVTAPEISPLFGRLLGRFVARAAGLIPGEEPLAVLELGAGSGRLAAAATAAPELAGLLERRRALWVSADLSYAAAPPEVRGGFRPVAAAGTATYRTLPRAVVVANEYFDAQPCAVVERRGGSFREIRVGLSDGRLVETSTAIDDPLLAAHLAEHGLSCPEGGRLEVGVRVKEALADLSCLVGRGLLVIVDYGGTAEELASRAPTGGTVRVFSGHAVGGDPLEQPGSVDLTADVNFSDLARWAAEAGWEIVSYSPQRDVLLALGLLEEVALLARETDTPGRLTRYLAAKRFLLEEGLQERFRVLVLGKGLSREAREAGEFLGLLAPAGLA